MKNTILNNGKGLRNTIRREAAWFRVRKYWLTMPRKEYCWNLVYNITGMLTIFVGFWSAVYALMFKGIPALLTKLEK